MKKLLGLLLLACFIGSVVGWGKEPPVQESTAPKRPKAAMPALDPNKGID